ncbi:MAG: hypothetical protein GY795_26800 [Desulfobacterales bacterium]|nr:hypothetical protein [Desulfobacterales bacterium]
MNRFKTGIYVFLSIIIIGSFFSCSEEKKQAVQADVKNAAQADVKKLVGKWQRPDGGYLLDIRKTLDKGNLDAAYYNPREINVSRAIFMQKKETLKVFVELRDQGYPGSTYTLRYDPKGDVLAGDYFHAGMNQVFKVTFFRKKD